MKNLRFFLLLLFILNGISYSQNLIKTDQIKGVSALFQNQQILQIKLSYSNKDLNKNTNDSTYIKSNLSYQLDDNSWKSLEIDLRARGNFRRKRCYFLPLKIKIDKSIRKGTLFTDNKKLKLVMPCFNQKNANDNVVNEYIAYKLFEIISPFHFKTRLTNIDFTEIRRKKIINHSLKGFFIEDIKKVAKRHNGKVLKRFVHPLQQEEITSVKNAFFQFMIGNTDFSVAYQHNGKLLFIDKKTIVIPYDFDLSGLVDASYAVVSEIQKEPLDINKVTQRMYRGFKRDPRIFKQVRNEFLDNKIKILQTMDSYESIFNDPKEFLIAKDFILDFFKIIEDDKKFKKYILDKARTK